MNYPKSVFTSGIRYFTLTQLKSVINELECNMKDGTFQLSIYLFNPFKPSVAFYIETSH